jgi:hypothetical protein
LAVPRNVDSRGTYKAQHPQVPNTHTLSIELLKTVFLPSVNDTAYSSQLGQSSNMSCNICHTPILVHSNFLDPRDPSSITQDDHLEPIFSKVCPPASHQQYFKNVVQLDRRLEGVKLNELVHAGRGVFMSTQFRICGGCANIVKQEEVSPDGITGGCVRILCSKSYLVQCCT